MIRKVIFLMALILPVNPLFGGETVVQKNPEEVAVRAVVHLFLEALRTADPDIMKSVSNKSPAHRLRVALGSDPEYARMIRFRYGNARMEVQEVIFQSKTEGIVEILIEYLGGEQETVIFGVYSDSAGQWMLGSEIRKP